MAMWASLLGAWWFWAVLAVVLAGLALVAGFGAVATLTATGAHHHALSRRQRRMGRLAFFAGLGSAPVLAVGAVLAAALAVWRLLAGDPAPSPPRAPSATAHVQVLASERFVIPGLGRERQIRLYLPPGYAASDRRYPVIYLHDGQNLFDDATSYAGEWGVDEALDALAASDGFEAIAVGVDNGGERRMNELSPWPNARFGAAEGEAYLRFITDVVKPYVDTTYRTRPERATTALVGSSMGGLMSHYGLLARPDVFGRIGVLSPSYWYSDAVYAETGRFAPPADTRVVLYAGDDEGDPMVEGLQRMQALLAPRLAEGHLRVHVAEGAEHNEAAWRAEFPATVRFLFALYQAPPSAP